MTATLRHFVLPACSDTKRCLSYTINHINTDGAQIEKSFYRYYRLKDFFFLHENKQWLYVKQSIQPNESQ